MKYEKPEVVRVASAIDAVQNPNDKQALSSHDDDSYCSINAYAADE